MSIGTADYNASLTTTPYKAFTTTPGSSQRVAADVCALAGNAADVWAVLYPAGSAAPANLAAIIADPTAFDLKPGDRLVGDQTTGIASDIWLAAASGTVAVTTEEKSSPSSSLGILRYQTAVAPLSLAVSNSNLKVRNAATRQSVQDFLNPTYWAIPITWGESQTVVGGEVRVNTTTGEIWRYYSGGTTAATGTGPVLNAVSSTAGPYTKTTDGSASCEWAGPAYTSQPIDCPAFVPIDGLAAAKTAITLNASNTKTWAFKDGSIMGHCAIYDCGAQIMDIHGNIQPINATLIAGGGTGGSGNYNPAGTYPTMTGTNGRFAIYTDAPQIGFVYESTNPQIMLWINGQPFLPGIINLTSSYDGFVLDFTNASASGATFAGNQPLGKQHRLIEVSLGNNTPLQAVVTSWNDSVEAPQPSNALRALVYGDSYVVGGDSFPNDGRGYTLYRMCKMLGISDIVQSGVAGTGAIAGGSGGSGDFLQRLPYDIAQVYNDAQEASTTIATIAPTNGIVVSGTTATVTCSPGLATQPFPGASVTVAGNSSSALNGKWNLATAASGTSFTFTVPNGTASGNGGTVTWNYTLLSDFAAATGATPIASNGAAFDAIFVLMSVNDTGNTPAAIGAAYLALFQAIRLQCPTALIVFVGMANDPGQNGAITSTTVSGTEATMALSVNNVSGTPSVGQLWTIYGSTGVNGTFPVFSASSGTSFVLTVPSGSASGTGGYISTAPANEQSVVTSILPYLNSYEQALLGSPASVLADSRFFYLPLSSGYMGTDLVFQGSGQAGFTGTASQVLGNNSILYASNPHPTNRGADHYGLMESNFFKEFVIPYLN